MNHGVEAQLKDGIINFSHRAVARKKRALSGFTGFTGFAPKESAEQLIDESIQSFEKRGTNTRGSTHKAKHPALALAT
jgi:hypothetical protein